MALGREDEAIKIADSILAIIQNHLLLKIFDIKAEMFILT